MGPFKGMFFFTQCTFSTNNSLLLAISQTHSNILKIELTDDSVFSL